LHAAYGCRHFLPHICRCNLTAGIIYTKPRGFDAIPSGGAKGAAGGRSRLTLSYAENAAARVQPPANAGLLDSEIECSGRLKIKHNATFGRVVQGRSRCA
jgi:hypothetical protein